MLALAKYGFISQGEDEMVRHTGCDTFPLVGGDGEGI
jgi:hypothetical protein